MARRPPAERNPLVGRADEVVRIAEDLEAGARLLTLVGPAGVGKSRLARHVLAAAEDTVWVGVSPDRSLADAIAEACELAPGGLEEVAARLSDIGELVIVVDGAERCLDDACTTLDALLDVAQLTSFLVTTRQRLGLQGEVLIDVEPLPLDDARQLFQQRARGVGVRTVEVTDAHLERLDRLPLALELAAGRLRYVDIDTAVQQTSLEESLQRSWALLDAEVRDVLVSVSVFEGTFSASDAQAVIGGTVASALEAAADSSMLAVAQGTYAWLGGIRSFVRRQGDPSEAVARHTVFAASLSRDNVESWRADIAAAFGRAQGDLKAKLALLLAEASKTSGYAARQEIIEAGLAEARDEQLVGALLCRRSELLRLRGRAAEALEEARRALAFGDPEAHRALGMAFFVSQEHEQAISALGRGLDELEDGHEHARLLVVRAYARFATGDIAGTDTDARRAIELTDDAATLAEAGILATIAAPDRPLGPLAKQAGAVLQRHADSLKDRPGVLISAAKALHELGDVDEARRLAQVGLEWAERLGQAPAVPYAHETLAELAMDEARWSLAESELSQAALYQDHSQKRRLAFALFELGKVLWAQGRPARALAELERGLALEATNPQHASFARAFVGACQYDLGRYEESRETWRSLSGSSEPELLALLTALKGTCADGSDRERATQLAHTLATTGEDTLDQRIVRHVIRGRLEQLEKAPPREIAEQWTIAASGAWFRPPGEPAVSLGRRTAPKNILSALIKARGEGSSGLSVAETFAAGWPDVRIAVQSARTRVHTAVRTLRKLGLGSLLQTTDSGYCLDAEQRIEVVSD